VAVVKAGAFAIMRVTYYSFGKNFLRGTWVQYTVMMFAVVTMVYGAVKAVKEQDCKRRLAYSTVSNLSYIIFAASLMRRAGMQAAMLHMLFHGLMKITLFYCIGAVMVKAGKRYVWEMDGMGRKMPLIFTVYTVAGISLIGIPPLAGFASKWYIGTAAVLADTGFGYVGLGALILSALLSAAYVLEVVVRAWLPRKDAAVGEHSEDPAASETVPAAGTPEEPAKVGLRMAIPLIILMILIILCGVASTPIAEFLADVAQNAF
jgi:multicomponent Na+:H+ antiporter subunit D